MPSELKYDLDAELARMVELTRKAAEAAEAAAATYRRLVGPHPVASERRWYVFFSRNTPPLHCHLGPYLTEESARREGALVHREGLWMQSVQGCFVGYDPPSPHLDTLILKTGDK